MPASKAARSRSVPTKYALVGSRAMMSLQGESRPRDKCDAKFFPEVGPGCGSFSPLKPLRQSLNARVRVDGDSLCRENPSLGLLEAGARPPAKEKSSRKRSGSS